MPTYDETVADHYVDVLTNAGVSDYQMQALREACIGGSHFVRGVRDNLARAVHAANQGPANHESAAYWYEQAVTAWLNSPKH